MLSQPHEYTSLHADRASIGPISKQLSSTGQRDKEVVSPYMSFMRKQFSFSGPSSDVESSENTNDDDNDDDDNDYNDECGENEGSGSSPVNASSNASVRVEGSISNKMSGLFRPLGSLIEKARSLSRGRTRGTPTSDTTDQSRSESRGKGRMSTGQDTSIIYNERSVSNGRDRDSQRVSVNRSESRGKIRVDMQENNETSDSARHRSPARSPGTSKEKKSLLRPPIFSLSDDEN